MNDGEKHGDGADEAASRESGRVARLEVALEDALRRLELAQRIVKRQARELERLEREAALLRAEGESLRRQVDERSRLLATIFSSRSWRWAQALRRALKRS